MHHPDTFDSHSYAHKVAETMCDIHAIDDQAMAFRNSRSETRAGMTMRIGAHTWFHIYDHGDSAVSYRVNRIAPTGAAAADTASDDNGTTAIIAEGEFDTAYISIAQCAMACANIIRAVQV